MMDIEGWESKPLFELLDQIMDFRGRTPKKLDMEWGGGDIPALSANNVEMGEINFSKECYLASDALYRKWMTKGDTQKGDVVLTTEAPLGNVAVIPDEQRYILSQRVILLRANSAYLCSDYLSHYLMSEGFQNLMRQQSSGTTATGIQRAKLEPLLIKFPSSKIEQEQIAEVLSTIDRAIAQTEAIIAKQQRIKTGLMQDLLTKGIDENGNIRSEDTHEFKDSAIGRIPVEWEVCALGDKARIRSGSTPSRGNQKFWDEGIIPWVKTSEVNFSEITSTEERITELALHLCALNIELIDTVLVAMYGQGQTRGRCAILTIEATTNQACGAIFGNLGEVYQKYLFYYLSSQYNELRNVGHGSNQTNLNGKLLALFLIKFPTYEEQLRIANLLSQTDNQLSQMQIALTKLRSTKTGLMQDLLTGKVRVTNLLKEKAPAN